MRKHLYLFIIICLLSACSSYKANKFTITATPSLRVVYAGNIYSEFPIEAKVTGPANNFLIIDLQGYKKLHLNIIRDHHSWKIGTKYFTRLPAAIVVGTDNGVVHAYEPIVISHLLEKNNLNISPRPGYFIIDSMPGDLPKGTILVRLQSLKFHLFS